MAIEVFAAAKINLALHITGRRPDGYHDLDSLVVFADVGDRVAVRAAPDLSLALSGPQAAGLSSGEDNLVLRAARLLAGGGAAIALHKALPVASGIGGGSADAAAALRALAALWGVALPAPERILRLGADVPACLYGRPCRITGIGGAIAPLTDPLPGAALLLVHPGAALSTPEVFAALDRPDRAPLPDRLPRFAGLAEAAAFLAAQRNDLEAPAIRLLPVIAEVIAAVAAQPGCRLARMSGSGATCFGLFDRRTEAETAARALGRARPGWWVAAAGLAARP
jgi:4-diphosphocytidyl-2-C-methyl-D-erythritol kinase